MESIIFDTPSHCKLGYIGNLFRSVRARIVREGSQRGDIRAGLKCWQEVCSHHFVLLLHTMLSVRLHLLHIMLPARLHLSHTITWGPRKGSHSGQRMRRSAPRSTLGDRWAFYQCFSTLWFLRAFTCAPTSHSA